ncbi:MAG: hypothetical protein ACNA8P_11370, partial [Phycisphaerales bacterium]
MTTIDSRADVFSPSESQEEQAVAQESVYELIDELPEFEEQATELVSAEQAMRLRAVPLKLQGSRLIVAMLDPLDDGAADELSVTAARPITRKQVGENLLRELLRGAYGTTAADMAALLGGDDSASDMDSTLANLEA